MHYLCNELKKNELWLMERILAHAREQGYTKYTSTLVEAWRVSIVGLSDAIIQWCSTFGDTLPGFLPEERFEEDPIARFGVTEARLHRERGISLSMFLGLYKYYRYTFEEFAENLDVGPERQRLYRTIVERCLDRIEIAFCTQWSALNEDKTIAELQQANRLMTNEKNKYLTLFESLDAATFLVDERGLLDNANVPAANLLGRHPATGAMYYAPDKPDAASKSPLATLLPWLDAPLSRLLNGAEPSFRVELEEPKESGGRCFFATFSRMRDISGKYQGGVVVLDDITERKKLEKLKEHVEHITRHDLKVPLSGMLGIFNYLLEGKDMDPDKRRLLTVGRESGYTMLGLINRSLDLVKMEMGAYLFEPRPVDLRVVIRRVVEHLATLIKVFRVSISVDLVGADLENAEDGPFVLAEEMLLYTALGNLLENALEASPAGECVKVEVRADTTCRIAIFNLGGVPEAIRASFFDKYATWGKKNGTGLGTYSARLIVETMGGAIAMDTDGHSTTVTIDLPLEAEPPAAPGGDA